MAQEQGKGLENTREMMREMTICQERRQKDEEDDYAKKRKIKKVGSIF